MSKYANLIPAFDAIEAFGFWLKHSKPSWSISRPTDERPETGERYVTFVLYQNGASVGVYKTPMEALEVINDAVLTHEYLSIIADSWDCPAGNSH